jgi:hypothetical protein
MRGVIILATSAKNFKLQDEKGEFISCADGGEEFANDETSIIGDGFAS